MTAPLPIFFFASGTTASYAPPTAWYQTTTGEIDILQSYFDGDAKTLGHEMGHFTAKAAGFLNFVGGAHYALVSQRTVRLGTASQLPTVADAELAFNEGFADFYACLGAVDSPNASALSALPGFGPGQTHSLRGQSLDTNGGCGEDEELSVARILWQLQSDPLFASGASSTSWQQVFNAAKGAATRGGFTLYGLWLEITANVTDDNVLDRLARIFEAENVAPQPDPSNAHTVVTTAGATFEFWLPLVSGDTTYAPFTFDSATAAVTIQLFGPGGIPVEVPGTGGGAAQPFVQKIVLQPTGINGGTRDVLPPGLTEVRIVAATDDAAPECWFHGPSPPPTGRGPFP